MSIRNVKCGVSSCDAARVSRTGALRSQWCPAARLPTTVVTHSNWTRPDNTSRQLTASAAAAAGISPVAPPPVAFRNAVNAGIKKASLPVGKVRIIEHRALFVYSDGIHRITLSGTAFWRAWKSATHMGPSLVCWRLQAHTQPMKIFQNHVCNYEMLLRCLT